MNLLTIAYKSIRQRALASSLTGLSVALGVMLMVGVLVIFGIVRETFNQNAINYDLIIGPKGSPLELVLSTVYHVSPPIENLPYKFYSETIADDPRVDRAIPIAIGDTTQKGSFPIVGTTPEFFEIDYAPGREFRFKGRYLIQPFDAVIGSRVASENGWDLGSELKLVHSGADSEHVHDEPFTVVGILAPTGTPHDKSVYVHLDGFFQLAGHETPLDEAIKREREFFGLPPLSEQELADQIAEIEGAHAEEVEESHAEHGHHHHEVPIEQKEVTAVFVQAKTPMAAVLMASELKTGFQAQGVNPIQPMKRLMDEVVGNVQVLLMVLTGLIVVVSGIGIFVSIYNSMSDRRREIAIMRALGARRQTVFAIVLCESIMLCIGGGLVGLVLGHGLVYLAAPIVEQRSGIIMDPLAFEPLELVLFPALLTLASLVGFIPGMTAYRTDVAKTLAE